MRLDQPYWVPMGKVGSERSRCALKRRTKDAPPKMGRPEPLIGFPARLALFALTTLAAFHSRTSIVSENQAGSLSQGAGGEWISPGSGWEFIEGKGESQIETGRSYCALILPVRIERSVGSPGELTWEHLARHCG